MPLDKTLLAQVKLAFVPMPGGRQEPVAGSSQMTAALAGGGMGGQPGMSQQGMPPQMPPGMDPAMMGMTSMPPQGGQPPMDPNAGGQPPMDPSMMGGQPGMPSGVPPGMDPAMMGMTGQPPMDPSMMGGQPPMDPSMMGGQPATDPDSMPVGDMTVGELRKLIAEAVGSGAKGKSEGSGEGKKNDIGALTEQVQRLVDTLSGGGGAY